MSQPPVAADGTAWSVVFVCDLGPAVGVGHLMRCLALAEEFVAQGHRATFVVDASEVPMAAQQLAARRFAVVEPPPADRLAEAMTQLRPDLVVVDSYLLPLTTYDAIRAAGLPLLVLVDGDPGGRNADLYLDQNIGAEDDTWALAAGATRLAGLEFALQRREIREARPDVPQHREADPVRVLGFFGGTDAFGIAPEVAAALVETGERFDLTVIAARPEMRAALAAIQPALGQTVTAIDPTADLAALINAHDISVAAAGSSLWELACLGSAAAVVCVVDNQRDAYERVVDSGLFVGLGMLNDLRVDRAVAVERLSELLKDPSRRAELRERAWRTVDGRGAQRVVAAAAVVIGGRSPE